MTASNITSGKAPRWVTMWNPVTRALLGARLPLGPNALLTIPGRKSGVARVTPLAIVQRGGRRWVWAPWGNAQWVQNLRVAGGAMLTMRGAAEAVRVTELDEPERVTWFRDVLLPVAQGMPLGVQFVRVIDQVDVNRPEEAAQGRAVFELHPTR